MTLVEFSRQIFAVISAIQDSLEQFPLDKDIPAPANWSEIQSILQRVAEDLMICASVTDAVAKLRQDQGTLLVVGYVAIWLEDSLLKSTIQRAYAETPEASWNLPGQPFAAYLLEICKGPPHLIRRDMR